MTAKKKSTMNSRKHRAEVSKELSTMLRQRLEEKLGVLPNDLLIEFGSGPKAVADIKQGKIKTDWPDSFDRNTWYKTWAKSGGEVLPSELIAARAAANLANGK